MKRLPALPTAVHSLLGPIPVTLVKGLDRTHGALGRFVAAERRIEVGVEQCEIQRHHTYYHESFHVMLWDSGSQLEEKVEEALCDCYATWKVSELLAR